MNPNDRICPQPKEAVRLVLELFPFKNYFDPEDNSHLDTAASVARHLPRGAKILDFGSGPCDKTAVLQAMGYECYAYDDLSDAWHVKPGVREKITSFAQSAGVQFSLAVPGIGLPYRKEYFDMVILNDVMEHLHDSPKELLNDLLELVTPMGLMLITVPNAGNIRKRLALLSGGTNYPQYDYFYWNAGQWRGHVREYVKEDLIRLSEYLDLEVLELRGCDRMLTRVPRPWRRIYVTATNAMKGLKDTWTLVARKRLGWKPQRELPAGMKLSRPTQYLYEE